MTSTASRTTAVATLEDILQRGRDTFRQIFGSEPALACCAPGRVNLIGEHVDYNDGFVLPMALPMVTVLVGGQRPDGQVDVMTCCASADEPRRVKFTLKDLQPTPQPKWANYVKGVVHGFVAECGNVIDGFNAVVVSNVPVGAGLSSSAALEVAALTFLEYLAGRPVESDVKRALICQAAEHEFAGMPCGIMDQMIAVVGRKDHALMLDCRSLETFQIPFGDDDGDLLLLICNSDVRHELSASEYPARRQQCRQALQLMALHSYRDATEDNLSALQTSAGTSEEKVLLLKRARHVITEIRRTREAADALRARNFHKMGELMTESHVSLRDDFQVSCPELDALVEAAINCAGVLGSRMTGGGFGGCTVTLLQRTAVASAVAAMRVHFARAFNKDAAERIEFYICTPSPGARRVLLP